MKVSSGFSDFGDKLERKEYRLISVIEWLKKCKPFNRQKDEDDNVFVRMSRVAKIMENPKAALNGGSPITMSHDGVILCGNHRYVALSELMKKDPKIGDYKFKAAFFTVPLTEAEKTEYAIRSNTDNAKTNYRAHAVKGKCEASVKVIKPVCDALILAQKAGENFTKNRFNPTRLNQLAMLIGSFFNANPSLVALMAKKEPLTVTSADIYTARNNEMAGAYFYNAKPKVDLRPYVRYLADILTDGCQTIMELKDRGIWKRKLRRNSTFEYFALALSLGSELFFNLGITREEGASNKKPFTYRRLETVLNSKIDKIMDVLEKEFSINPNGADSSLRRFFRV